MKDPETFVCDHCSAVHPLDECTLFNGIQFCPDCLQEQTILCECCGERIWADANAGDSNTPLCQDCHDAHYTTCIHCGAVIRQSIACYRESDEYDEYPYCPDCFAVLPKDCINNYHYKPEPIFYGEDSRYFGVELEIDGGGEEADNAWELLCLANYQQEQIYCKHDGSLDNGFEIVTYPMTLRYHMDEMPWPEVLSKAIRMGYLSHQACTCGLHVHVNRNAFGETETKQEDVIARILFFVENHWNEMLRFSRRSKLRMEQWAARYGRKDDPKAVLDNAKKSRYERYKCVNLTNRHTIEFRMFRGTLKLNTLLATLQMVDRICEVALYLSDGEMQELTWTNFVSGCTAPELVQYLKERRLYVSDPVESEVEV